MLILGFGVFRGSWVALAEGAGADFGVLGFAEAPGVGADVGILGFCRCSWSRGSRC